jgi:hypothetical protein
MTTRCGAFDSGVTAGTVNTGKKTREKHSDTEVEANTMNENNTKS